MLVIKPSIASINAIVEVIKRDGVVVFPTDTAYGLGGVFDSKKVIKKVLAIKKRKDKKFVLVASSLKQVKAFFNLNSVEEKLAKKYWPGPLSIVVSKKFSIRVPDNQITRQLCQLAGKPLIATSANLSGQSTVYNTKSVINYFKENKDKPDLILDAGRLKKKKTSTLVKVSRNKIKILRAGAIKIN
ncbi:MAG: threonylcarbamoyl-AMP synthase [Candidatus Buchananbacteria bacterium]|nr:threonylcarbamoyl-AMP synthase [Candidatus Buchananbacteria bacterium]